MSIVYIATSNQGKLRDFQTAAAAYGIEIAPVPNISQLPAVVEDQDTFEGNARKKAEFYSSVVPDELVLGDDSGLEVDALGGAPGVISARYAAAPGAENSSDAANNSKLRVELASVPDDRRRARFVCVIAAARNGKIVETFRDHAEGRILRDPRGARRLRLRSVVPLPSTWSDLRRVDARTTYRSWPSWKGISAVSCVAQRSPKRAVMIEHLPDDFSLRAK